MKITRKSITLITYLGLALACMAAAEAAEAESPPAAEPVSLEAARDRAQLLQRVYLATLDTIHDYYFEVNRAVLPARAMEDVFREIGEQTKIEARWIAVNTPPMSVSHTPRTEFEKQAAEAIAAGKPFVEQIERGMYSRAGAVPLVGACAHCHLGFKDGGSKPRFAGLVLRIPLREGSLKPH